MFGRRRLLASAAGLIGGAAVVARPEPAGAAPATPEPAGGRSGVVDVTDHGAAGDGVTVDTAAIQRAVDDAAARGGIVYFPPGHYRVTAPGIRITRPLQLQGVGWEGTGAEPGSGESGAVPAGSWLFWDDPTTPVVTIAALPGAPAPSGVIIRDLAVRQAQPAGSGVFPEPAALPGFVPVPSPFAVVIGPGCTDVLLERLFLLNVSRGIAAGLSGGLPTGRLTLRGIWGQPLIEGISIDHCLDTVRIEDIHFWPYWKTGPVTDWQVDHGVGLTLRRVDNPLLRGLFCYGYRTGLALLTGPSGSPHKVKVSDADFDKCRTGIQVAIPTDAFGVHSFANVSVQGPDTPRPEDDAAVDIVGAGVRASFTNLAVTHHGGSALRVSGPGSVALADLVVVDDVDLAGRDRAALVAAAGAVARIGPARHIVVPGGAREADGNVQLA